MSEGTLPYVLTKKDREFLRLQRIKPDDEPEPAPTPARDDDDGEQTDIA